MSSQHLQIVIVLYKTELENSSSYTSLKKYCENLRCPYSLLIYNNSSQIAIPQSDEYKLITPPENQFLASAYNMAIEEACRNNAQWLLVLDQDSNLTPEFLRDLSSDLASESDDDKVAAILPTVISASTSEHLSPYTYHPSLGLTFGVKPIKSVGIYPHLEAVNSGSVFRVSAIKAIGGFPSEYPLDGLDLVCFYRLHNAGYLFKVINTVFKHDLSIKDYAKNMNTVRYVSIVKSEIQLAREMGAMPLFLKRIRLSMRILKLSLSKNTRVYAKLTLKMLLNIDTTQK